MVDIEGSGWTRVDSSRLLCSQGFSLGNFLPSSGVLVSGAIYHGLRRAFRTLTMFEMVDKEGSGWTRVDSSRLLCSQGFSLGHVLPSSGELVSAGRYQRLRRASRTLTMFEMVDKVGSAWT